MSMTDNAGNDKSRSARDLERKRVLPDVEAEALAL